MKYEDIKDFSQRCEEHPDHQCGIITNQMLINRLEEEIDELRAYIESRQWVGLTDEERRHFNNRLSGSGVAEEIEAKLKEKNT